MEILNYDEKNASSSVLAEFSIYWGPQYGMTFHKWKLIRSKRGDLFVTGPSYSTEVMDGFVPKKEWHQMIEFSKEKNSAFQKKVLELLEPFMRK